jgi:TRAP-type C4-dicarboxylate transport system permease large subunit
VQSVRGSGSIREVITGVTPFVLTMIGMIGLLLAFPELATFLPSLLATKS